MVIHHRGLFRLSPGRPTTHLCRSLAHARTQPRIHLPTTHAHRRLLSVSRMLHRAHVHASCRERARPTCILGVSAICARTCVYVYVQPANAFVRYIFMPEMADIAATGCDCFSGGPRIAHYPSPSFPMPWSACR